MKKSDSLVVMFIVVMAVASASRAEEMVPDFDGRSGKGISSDGIKTGIAEADLFHPVAAIAVEAEKPVPVFYKLGKVGRRKLRDMVLKEDVSLDRNVVALINSNNTDILYNDAGVVFVNLIKGNSYNTILECSDRRLIALLREQTLSGQAKGRRQSPVCELVERTLWVLVQGVWTEVIKQVRECHTEPDSDNSDNGGSGSTYHNGQGGDSPYDVNKSLKLDFLS